VRRPLAFGVLPALLAAGLIGVTSAGHTAVAAPMSSQGCILGILCIPSSSPSPTPTPTATTATPAPTATPSPSASAPGSTVPSATPTGSVPAAGSTSPSASSPGCILGIVCLSGSPSPTSTAQRTASAAGGTVAAAATSVLTAGSAALTGFTYQGNVNMPVAGGTEAMMKFTADSVDLSGGVTVVVTQDGTTVTTDSATQAFSDGVTLYATKLSGTLAGVPLTFTPDTVSAVLLTVASVLTGLVPITMTGVTTDQLLISAGLQQTTQLSMS
jgi:hypothetical protein